MISGLGMPDGEHDLNGRRKYRYPVTDPETKGVYIVVSETSKTTEEIEQIIASVIHDQGRVGRHKIRTILV